MKHVIGEKSKQAVALLCALLLAMGMLPMATAFADEGGAVITVGAPIVAGGALDTRASYEVDDTFIVPINLASNPGVGAGVLELVYNEQALKLIDLIVYRDDGNTDANGNPTQCTDDLNLPRTVGSRFMPVYDVTVANTFGFMSVNTVSANGVLFYAEFKVIAKAPYNSLSTVGIQVEGALPQNFYDASPVANNLIDTSSGVPVGAPSFSPTLPVAQEGPAAPLPASITVGSPVGTFAPGETFEVGVSIEDNPGFLAASFTLAYNSKVLEFLGLGTTSGTLFGSTEFVNIDTATVSYVGGSQPGEVTGVINSNGVLFNASFKVKASVTAASTQTVGIGLQNDEPLNFVTSVGAAISTNFFAGTVSVVEPSFDGARIRVGAIEATAGQTEVKVPVTISQNPGFASYTFAVNYDAAKLTLDRVDTSFSAALHSISDNKKSFGGALLSDFTPLEAQIFELVFTVNDQAQEGIADVSLALFNNSPNNFKNYAGLSVPVTFSAGSIDISIGTPTTKDDLTFDAYDEELTSTWTRTYNGAQQSIAVAGRDGIGAVTAVYYNNSTTAPTNVGSYTVAVDVAAAEGKRPANKLELGTLIITKAAAPFITWPTAAGITYGQPVSAATLSVTSNDFGSFAWDSAVNLDATPVVGSHQYAVVFTPSASTLQNYEGISPLSKDVTVAVSKAAAPSFSWPVAGDITFGQTLADATLTPSSNDFGSFAWVAPTSEPQAGANQEYDVVFIPSAFTQTNFEAVDPAIQPVSITVHKATAPTLTWPTAAPIQTGKQLSSSVLTPASNDYGTFAWQNGTETFSAAGQYERTVVFTPSAASQQNYTQFETTHQVSVAVVKPGVVDDPVSGYPTAGDVLLALKASISAITLTPAQFVALDIDGDGFITASDVLNVLRMSMGDDPILG